jgi:hypothetical protein
MTEDEREKLVAEAETMHAACPYCRLPVAVLWTPRGFIPSAEWTLAADCIYHADCWDKQLAENPPVTL